MLILDPAEVPFGEANGDLQSVTFDFIRPEGIYDSFIVYIHSPSNPNFAPQKQEIIASSEDANITVRKELCWQIWRSFLFCIAWS